MAPKQSSPSIGDASSDDEYAPDSFETNESSAKSGSDTGYKCESKSDLEADSDKMKSKTNRSNSNTKANPSTSVAKRAREKENGMSFSKKTKETKPNLSSAARVWSENDEIALLKGMIDFLKKNKTYDFQKFYCYMKKSFHADMSKAQVGDKLSRLKRKYRKNEDSRRKNGEELVFSKSHEKKLFELSKKVWGMTHHTTNNTINDEGGDKCDDDSIDAVVEGFDRFLISIGLNWKMIDEENRVSLEKKWRKVRVVESKFRLVQAKFESEVHQVALNAYNSLDY